MFQNKLIISDIHLNDYQRFNIHPEARLEQFRLLAKRVVELGVEYKCDELVICGDFFDKPINRPYVLHEGAQFLRDVGLGFKVVYYILGQHDRDGKGDEHKLRDCPIHCIIPENFKYMDKVQTELWGRKVGFMDWRVKQDLSWVDGQLDVFFGHVTVSNLFGQSIDTSKFKLGIVGDIHVHGRQGNLVMIGTPLQQNMSSQAEGTAVVYNPNTNKAVHIKTDPNHDMFLQMVYTPNQEEEGFDENGLTYRIYRPKNAIGRKLSDIKDEPTLDINVLISNEVKNSNLEDIHNKVLGKAKCEDILDANFKLISIDIKNFRSIKRLHYEFGTNTLVFGNNGSGKSSFILAIYKALVGDRQLGQSISFGESEISIILTLEYNGIKYEIERGNHWGLRINDNPEREQYNNKGQFDNDIPVRLPFIKYIDSFYFNYWNVEILNSINNQRRVELLTKYNRLNILDSYHAAVIEIIETLQSDINTTKKEIISLEASVTQNNVQRENLNNRKLELESLIEYTEEECNSIVGKYDTYKSNRDKRNLYLDCIKKFEETCSNSDKELADSYKRRSDWCNSEITKINESITSWNSTNNQLEKFRVKIKNCTDSINKLEKEIVKVQGKVGVKCSKCGTIMTKEATDFCISGIKSEIESLKATKKDFIDEGSKLIVNYKTCKFPDAIKKYNKDRERLTKLFEYNTKRCNEEYSKVLTALTALESKLKYEEELKSLAEPPDEDSILSQDISSYRNCLNNLFLITEINNQLTQLDSLQLEAKLESTKITLESKQSELKRHVTYRDLMSKNGLIYRKILDDLAIKLSNDQFKFNAVSQRVSGNEFFDVSVQFKVGKKFVAYKDLSSGQRTLCDLYFISRTISKGGILVLDEFLRFLDAENHDAALDIISETDVNQIIVSSHNHNFSIDQADTILFYLDNGETNAQIYKCTE